MELLPTKTRTGMLFKWTPWLTQQLFSKTQRIQRHLQQKQECQQQQMHQQQLHHHHRHHQQQKNQVLWWTPSTWANFRLIQAVKCSQSAHPLAMGVRNRYQTVWELPLYMSHTYCYYARIATYIHTYFSYTECTNWFSAHLFSSMSACAHVCTHT